MVTRQTDRWRDRQMERQINEWYNTLSRYTKQPTIVVETVAIVTKCAQTNLTNTDGNASTTQFMLTS